MFVYRVENRNGEGPYVGKGSGVSLKLHRAHWDHTSYHVGCYWDFIKVDTNYVCGFASIKLLYTWFKGFCYDLHKDGYMVSVYVIEEDDVIIGKSGRQLMFYKKKAEKIEEIPLMSFRKRMKSYLV